MVDRKHFVWLLVAALALFAMPSGVDAKWTQEIPGQDPNGSFIGPNGEDDKGGIDPDEPLGPERVAGGYTESPGEYESELMWVRIVKALVRLDWAGWLSR